MKAFTLEELQKGSKSFRERNPWIDVAPQITFAGSEQTKKPPAAATSSPLKGQQPRVHRCNKTEQRFLQWLRLHEIQRGDVLLVQPPRLFELEGGGTYTPDFVVVKQWGLDVFEVKGGYQGPGWEQGIERYKRAAAQFAGANVHFTLANWNRKENTWETRQWKTKD
ncbi:MAG: hypothetical protein IKS20_12980 [Victivallales bacterium]|nr:hypothetical protein [Victivallales bacterium]